MQKRMKKRKNSTFSAFLLQKNSISFAKKAADYIIFMDQGKIIEMGDVSILENPNTEELKQFLSNVFLW